MPTSAPGELAQQPKSDVDLSPESIARTDPAMLKLLQDREHLSNDIELTRQRFGYGDAHPEIALKKVQLEQLDRHIARYAADYRSLQAEIKLQVAPLHAFSFRTGQFPAYRPKRDAGEERQHSLLREPVRV